MQRLFIAPVLALAMIFSLFSPHFAGASDQWPMYQGNASHTGFVPVTLDPTKFSLRWQNTLSLHPLNPVTAAGGRVFVSELRDLHTTALNLYALDSISGNIIWSQNFGNVYSVNPPSYDNGKVYIQTGQEASYTNGTVPYLSSYDAATGTVLFRSPFGAQWERYYAPTIYGGNVYIDGGNCGGMYSFDGSTGNQDWFDNRLPQYDQWTPAVDENLAYAYLGYETPALYVVDRLTGQAVFNIPDPNFTMNSSSMNLAPVLGGLSDLFAIQGGRLIRFDLNARDINWVNAPNFSGQPTVAGGVIYAVNSGSLGAYDQTTGTLQWTWAPPAGETLQDSIIATNSHLFVGSAVNTYCIDLTTKQEVWSYPAVGHLALGENTLYIAGASGTLTAIDLGLAVPDIYAIESVNFGTADVGQTVTQTISITNVGAAPLEVQSIVSSSAEFVVQSVVLPLTIAPHQSAPINVQFAPLAGGTRSGNLLIASNDPNEPQISAALTGQADLTVVASAGQGGYMIPSGNVSVLDGSSLLCNIYPDQGYKILDVVVDEISQGPINSYLFNPVSGDHSITASFTPIIYHSISATAGAGGQINPSGSSIQVADGDFLVFTVTPDPGYALTALSVDGVSVGGPSIYPLTYNLYTIVSDHTVTAVFARYFDYFGMQADNFLNLIATHGREAVGYTENISLDTTSFSSPSYVAQENLDGNTTTTWYQSVSNGLFMLQTASSSETLTFEPALPVIQTPLTAGEHWTANSTVTVSGVPVTATITAAVSPQVLVSVQAGHFMAWPIAYRLTFSARGRTTATAWTDWFAPYFGFIKERDPNATTIQLESFAVGGGTITTPPPVVTGTVPKSVAPGSTIKINGFQFGASQGSSQVMIGNVECDQIASWTDTQIDCTIPATTVSGAVTVVTDTWTSNNSITLTILPEVTGVTPSSGQRSSTVQVLGTGFGTVAGKVYLGAVRANVTQWGDSSITCTVPASMPYAVFPVTVINSQRQKSVLQRAFTVLR